MPNFYREEECGAVPGVMGWKACTNKDCSCNEPEEDPLECQKMDEYYKTYYNKNLRYYGPTYNDVYLHKIGLTNIVHQTDKAILFSNKSKDNLIWIPKYILYSNNNLYYFTTNNLGKLTVKEYKESVIKVEDVSLYKGMLRKDIRSLLIFKPYLTFGKVMDVGFSKTDIYLTIQQENTLQIQDYIKQNYKKVYKKLWN